MVRKILTIAILASLTIACAPFAAAQAPALNADQVSLVQAICDQVMGLKPGGIYRIACVESLSGSLARKMEAAAMADNYNACGGQGLPNGSPTFATCMLDRQATNRAAAAMTPVRLSYDSNAPENANSYFDVPPTARWLREQYSCAQLGLTPGSGAFGQCVASLDADLFNPD